MTCIITTQKTVVQAFYTVITLCFLQKVLTFQSMHSLPETLLTQQKTAGIFCKYKTQTINLCTIYTSSYSFAIFMVACPFYILLFIYDSYYMPFRVYLALLRNIYNHYRTLMRRPDDSYCRNSVKCYISAEICW